jgi:metal-responsive CopG/Arc/MetJ family transcriptional regulator
MTTFTQPERVPLPFNVRLSHELVSDLDALAARHQTTRSRIIRGLLQQGLEQIKGSDDANKSAQ